MALIDLLALLALAAIWGGSFIFMRFLSPILGPVTTTGARVLIGGLFLWALFADVLIDPQVDGAPDVR